MKFAVLSSGSKANCTLIMNGDEAFLIDCGLSAKETISRLNSLGINPTAIKGIFVTHEHRDHTSGIRVLSKKLGVPVFCNFQTSEVLKQYQDFIETNFEIFKTGQTFNLGSFEIQPFAISHDAIEPVGYAVYANGLKLVYATDMGKVTTLVKNVCVESNALILEFNHDEDALWRCDYPWELKQRITSNRGHLSNVSATDLIAEVFHDDLKHLVMAHISEHSNTPELVSKTLETKIDTSKFFSCHHGSPYHTTPLITVCEERTVYDMAS